MKTMTDEMNDLISRQAAITIPIMPKEHRHYQTSNLDDAYDQGWLDLEECIKDLPSAQPERPTGRWKKSYVYQYNYCPYCGAWLGEQNDI